MRDRIAVVRRGRRTEAIGSTYPTVWMNRKQHWLVLPMDAERFAEAGAPAAIIELLAR